MLQRIDAVARAIDAVITNDPATARQIMGENWQQPHLPVT